MKGKLIFTGRRLIMPLILTLAAIGGAAALLTLPAAVSAGVRQGLTLCLNAIIPSLFPFMALSEFIVRSNISGTLSIMLSGFVRHVFKLPTVCAGAVLMSFVGGYPTGAKIINEMYLRGAVSTSQAKRMLSFCVAAGPAFIITAVGARILQSPAIGYILFASHILAALILGALYALKDEVPVHGGVSVKLNSLSGSVVGSVTSACTAIINVCSYIVIFCAVTEILRSCLSPLPEVLQGVLGYAFTLLEVSGGCVYIAGRFDLFGAAFLSFLLGFGGLCVVFQVLSIASALKLRFWDFFRQRVMHGLLSAALTVVMILIFDVTPSAVRQTSVMRPALGTSIPTTICLVMICAFIFSSMSKPRIKD